DRHHRSRRQHGRRARMRCERLVFGSLRTLCRLHEPSLSRRQRRAWAWARLLWTASTARRVRTAARRRLSRLLLGTALGLGVSALVKGLPFGGMQSFFGSFYRRCARARFLDLPWCAA